MNPTTIELVFLVFLYVAAFAGLLAVAGFIGGCALWIWERKQPMATRNK